MNSVDCRDEVERNGEGIDVTIRKGNTSGFRGSSGKLQGRSIAGRRPCIEYGGFRGSTGGNSKRRLAMENLVWKVMVAGIFLLGFLSVGVRAQGNDSDGCTNATLKGDYAFTVSGTIWVKDPYGVLEEVHRGGIAMTHFDGRGGLSQVDYVISGYNNLPTPPTAPSDPVTGFHIDETGTYKVYSDCTGTFTINSPGTTITVDFVLSDHGRAIHTIVTSLMMFKPSGPVAVQALIHSEGHKLGRIPEELE